MCTFHLLTNDTLPLPCGPTQAHTDFVTTFRFFKASHFSYASALCLNLVVYRYFIVSSDVYFR